ncbi:MAG: SLBB domain-containing protein [Candidatus Eisenbacteria bacterium]|nr:SLBB domain-containing protein [Candidatus Eisenbacteria bacterium]
MRHSLRRHWACLAVVAFTGALALPAAAQGLDGDLLDLIRDLPQDQREELLRAYGLPPSEGGAEAQRDVSTPELVAPREQPASQFESTALGEQDTLAPENVPVRPPLELMTEEALEIRRAFENFLDESQPLTVDENLRQFGYELFAGAPTTFAPATDIPVSADYIIGPGDEIHIQLYGKTDLSRDLVVDRDGLVSFPELGPIAVAGLTFSEMKDRLSREVENRMIGVSVSVSMGRLRSIRIFVLGDVFRPGSYTVSGLSTLTNALLASGGVLKTGTLRRVQLKRAGKTVKAMDLYDLLLEGDTSDDVRLMPGDVIFVPTVGPLVGAAGEVIRPAIYEMNGSMTARELIEVAGGLKSTAYRDLAQIERIDGGRRVTHDMTFDETVSRELRGGDLLKIYPIPRGDELAVFLDGNVVRPGRREYSEGMTLLGLLPSIDALLPETYFRYGLIERESAINREPEYLAFDLGAALLDGVPEANVVLAPRDRVYVFHRAHFREAPRVSIRGEVRSEGSYEYKKDMRILDLVLAAGGLTRDAWMGDAELFRTEPHTMDVLRVPVNVGRVLAADPAHNLVLQDMDEVAIHSVWEFRERDTVEILGEVRTPGTYPLSDGMRVSDLVYAGGNLKETAYRREAELTRYDIVDGERRELRHVVVNLEDVMEGVPEADIVLRPYDRLLIRRLGNWRVDEVIAVSGEVAFPGTYPIEEGERLSDLIERFGGFLEGAYLPAAVLTREEIRTRQAEQLQRMADQLEADLARLSAAGVSEMSPSEQARRKGALESGAQLVEELRNATATGRMVISLAQADELKGTEQDLVLADGDRLLVPKKPDFVMVMGQVNNPTAFQFERGKRASHFIRLAGGITDYGNRGDIYVVKADGSVEMGSGAGIDPGDVVVVPESLERFDGMQFLMDMSQVLYQIGLAAASAYTVGLFK